MSSYTPVKLGVIGAGVIGTTHARAAASIPKTELVAVADLRLQVARELADDLGCRAYGDATELLDDPEVEAVVLALPASVRTGICLQAFERGMHVLNEKPISMNPEETEGLIDAHGDLVAACCSSRMRLTNAGRKAAEFVAEGHLGELRVIRVRAILGAEPPPPGEPPVPWRFSRKMNAGGIMSNWGCYDLDFILGVFGWQLRPQQVLGNTWTVAPELANHIAPESDAETHITMAVRCQAGPVILYERGEQVAHTDENAWSLTGTRGTLHYDVRPQEEARLVFDSAEPDRPVETRTVWEGHDSWDELHERLIRDFADAVRTEAAPGTSFEQALMVQRITHAAYESAETGEAFSL